MDKKQLFYADTWMLKQQKGKEKKTKNCYFTLTGRLKKTKQLKVNENNRKYSFFFFPCIALIVKANSKKH